MALPVGSQFLITARPGCGSLDDKHPVFGRVVEGLDSTIAAINAAYADERGRPYTDIRIRHTYVLIDPFPDPPGMRALWEHSPTDASASTSDASPPSPDRTVPAEETVPPRLSAEEAAAAAPLDIAAESAAVEALAEREDRSRAVVLEMIGDLPSADAAPPPNVLFVAKLNPVTSDADLDLIFSRFGDIVKCDIVRDWKTGASLCYGFVEFARAEDAEAAFFKMDNVLIDDRRIKVDFSQSVSHLWHKFRRGGGSGGGGGGSAAPHAVAGPQGQQQQQQLPPPSFLSSSVPATAAPIGEGGRKSRWGAPTAAEAAAAAGVAITAPAATAAVASVAAAGVGRVSASRPSASTSKPSAPLPAAANATAAAAANYGQSGVAYEFKRSESPSPAVNAITARRRSRSRRRSSRSRSRRRGEGRDSIRRSSRSRSRRRGEGRDATTGSDNRGSSGDHYKRHGDAARGPPSFSPSHRVERGGGDHARTSPFDDLVRDRDVGPRHHGHSNRGSSGDRDRRDRDRDERSSSSRDGDRRIYSAPATAAATATTGRGHDDDEADGERHISSDYRHRHQRHHHPHDGRRMRD